MAGPPRSQTDEWAARIRKAQADVAAFPRQRRITDELELMRAGKQWKSVPLTVGALIAIVSLLVGMSAVYRGYYADVRSITETAVRYHDGAASAHQSIQAQQRQEWANINKQLGEMKATLGKLSDKLDRRRRR